MHTEIAARLSRVRTGACRTWGFAIVISAMCGAAHGMPGREVTYYLTDPNGNVLATTDASGNLLTRSDYRPYGQQALPAGSADQPGYAGHLSDDESGLTYMQARYDDVSTGRFISVDPFAPTPGDIFGFNRFAYGSNNPISNIDPTGMDDCASQSSDAKEPCPAPTTPTTPEPQRTITNFPAVPVRADIPRPVSVPNVPVRVGPILLTAVRGFTGALFFVDSNYFNETILGRSSCYGSISCGTFVTPLVLSLPHGVWPADKGAEEWGRRHGVTPKEARDRFHDIKQGDGTHSGGKANWGVNPNTGDVYDPDGEVHGNLGD